MAVSKKITIHPSSGDKKVIATPAKVDKVEEVEETPQINEKLGEKKRVCFFCQNKKDPTYTDLATLKRYVNDRGKIIPRMKTGICSKHQRAITRGIKYARHLALLPFTPKV